MMTKSHIFLAATAFALAGAPALAQTAAAPAAAAAPSLAVGATIYDAQGGEVGKVAGVANSVVTVDTGTNKVGVAQTSFASGDKGPILGMTKTQLDDAAKGAAANAAAETAAALVPGAAVAGAAGAAIGKVEAVDGEFVTLATPTAKVRLPKTAFAKGPNGLVIGMTAAELDAAVKGTPKS